MCPDVEVKRSVMSDTLAPTEDMVNITRCLVPSVIQDTDVATYLLHHTESLLLAHGWIRG